jgi:drug/metabolite transporter (DMT)-like permease
MQLLDLSALVAVSFLWGTQYILAAKSLDHGSFDKLALARTITSVLLLILTVMFSAVLNAGFRAECWAILTGLPIQNVEPEDVSWEKRKRRIWIVQRNSFVVGVLCHGLGLSSCLVAENGISSGVMSIMFSLEPIVASVSSKILKLPDAPNLRDFWFMGGMVLSLCWSLTCNDSRHH